MEGDFTRQRIAREAKAVVALAFRNGPIEQIHAGQPCPTCTGGAGFSRITDAEMKMIMKNAVNRVYALLVLKTEAPEEYESQIRFGERYAAKWDEPEMPGGRSA
jgi:L-asparaginase II